VHHVGGLGQRTRAKTHSHPQTSHTSHGGNDSWSQEQWYRWARKRTARARHEWRQHSQSTQQPARLKPEVYVNGVRCYTRGQATAAQHRRAASVHAQHAHTTTNKTRHQESLSNTLVERAYHHRTQHRESPAAQRVPPPADVTRHRRKVHVPHSSLQLETKPHTPGQVLNLSDSCCGDLGNVWQHNNSRDRFSRHAKAASQQPSTTASLRTTSTQRLPPGPSTQVTSAHSVRLVLTRGLQPADQLCLAQWPYPEPSERPGNVNVPAKFQVTGI
jgi:hypothetical protein